MLICHDERYTEGKGQRRQSQIETDRMWPPLYFGHANMLHYIFYGSVWAQRGGLVCIQEGLW